jgi:transposase
VLDRDEHEVRRIRVRAGSRQVVELLEWADGVEPRAWAVESAGGMGYLLAQQLVAAGETVLDVPATLASRVRVLSTGQSSKSDPNDARSVAVAALHASSLAVVRRADHVMVCRLLAKRHTDVTRWRTKQCCRTGDADGDAAAPPHAVRRQRGRPCARRRDHAFPSLCDAHGPRPAT